MSISHISASLSIPVAQVIEMIEVLARARQLSGEPVDRSTR
jgi:hypothetical protein